MCRACQLAMTPDLIRDSLRKIIADQEWAVVGVAHDRTPFSYTVGLTGMGLPELHLDGIGPLDGQSILNELAKHTVTVGILELGAIHELDDGSKVRIDPKINIRDLKGIFALYGDRTGKARPVVRDVVILDAAPTGGSTDTDA